jgi:hypothetical protein
MSELKSLERQNQSQMRLKEELDSLKQIFDKARDENMKIRE